MKECFMMGIGGGQGYILSRKAMKIISNYFTNIEKIFKNHIYEDVMIALILNEHNIKPVKIKQIIKSFPI